MGKKTEKKRNKNDVNLTSVGINNREVMRIHQGRDHYKSVVMQKNCSDNNWLPERTAYFLPVKWQHYFDRLASANGIKANEGLKFFLEEMVNAESILKYVPPCAEGFTNQSKRLYKAITECSDGDKKVAKAFIEDKYHEMGEKIQEAIAKGKEIAAKRHKKEMKEIVDGEAM